ncbi:hypothetical protein [Streptomyces sp. H27-C3]|uniref:hypothetical protein n=1 Tax=Streptomyces sp. H27-C3 TaxID=3046305 RepID=UPI0024B8B468|nr:hypothetical protein [Streptomyces sp. H27-C3]MDJ0466031.1 hypothetical protein [Streptomyces sp. H27-C3]
MDLFPIWKRYVRAVEQEFIRAGFPEAAYSVARDDEHRGSCVASWKWAVSTPLVSAQEWPEGLTLTWSSTGRWTYSALDDHRLENALVLPVPPLAAPSALSGLLPALMDGRHGQLPASEERWEHAGLLESCTESAALYGDDKYDAAYQAAEEEAETFLRWQEQLDSGQAVAAEPGAGLSEESGEPAGLTRYRVLAMRTDEAHPGAATLTNHTYARSAEEALAKVRRENERPGGLYGEQGLYRVVEVTEEGPAGEVLRQEAARRTFVDLVMNAARAETNQDITGMPNPEMFGVLCDFFTRAIVFPGFGFPSGSDPDDDQMHTSDPSRALSRLLLQHLTHHELDLVEADPSWPLLEGRPIADRASDDDSQEEGGEASPELIEQVLTVCEPHYAAVTGTSAAQWDKELSRELVGLALRTVRLADRKAYPQVLQAYLVENRARLEKLWRIYGPAGVFPQGVYHLVETPESFVLCERIDNAPMWLTGVWSRECESDTPLERLQEAWLYGTSESDGR